MRGENINMGTLIKNKRGISQLIVVALLIVFVIVTGYLIFRFSSESFVEESQKSADRATAQDICRSEVKIRINEVKDSGDFFTIGVENLKQKTLNDFLVRYELNKEVEIKKASQVLSGYEKVNVKVEKPGFAPNVIKIIPQIILEDELKSSERGWWLCSAQVAIYNL